MSRNNTARNPFGPAQTKLFKFILEHPGCDFNQIQTELFNDKRANYVSNLIYENQDYLSVQKFDNESMPNKYKVKVAKLGQMIDITAWVNRGVFEAVS